MHTVTAVSGKNGALEYKEECPNPACSGNTTWIYGTAFQQPICKDCKTRLKGKDLILYSFDRINYHCGR